MFNTPARIVALAALWCAGLGMPTNAARASPLLDLVGDTGATGGLQARTIAGGSAAAYFNPALLLEAPAGLTAGFMLAHTGIAIALDGRPGTRFAVPERISTAGHADGSRFDNYPIPTHWLQSGREKSARQEAFIARPRQSAGSGHDTQTYEVFGLVLKLFEDYVGLGLHVLIPNGEFTRLRAFFNDEREQYFSNSLHAELYSDRMTAVSLALGTGIRLSDQLSIGVGATLGLKANVVAATYVADTGDLSKILIDMDAPVNIGIAPHFGVSYRPIPKLQLSLSVHTPQRVELGSKFTFLLSNGIEQASGVTLVLDYTPWQVALGGAYDLWRDAGQTLTAAASLLYASWSEYVDRHGFEPTPGYAWADTISPMLGLRYRLHGLTAFADVGYVPTPVPKQTGRTNYVDNDRLSVSLGGEYAFVLFGTALTLGAGVQVHRLAPRHQAKLRTPTLATGGIVDPERVKDEVPDDAQIGGEPLAGAEGLQTNNPGWPGFASAGWILGANVQLSINF